MPRDHGREETTASPGRKSEPGANRNSRSDFPGRSAGFVRAGLSLPGAPDRPASILMKRLSLSCAILLSALLFRPEASAAPAATHLDDPGRLLAPDSVWSRGFEARLGAFERSTGIRILVQLHLKSPTEAEDKEPGAYMRALATRLGVIRQGVLVVYFADDPDWRVWIGDELTPAFTGKAGTAKEFTASGAMHEAKEAFLKAVLAQAEAALAGLKKTAPREEPPAGMRIALQADALVDGLIGKLGPRGTAGPPARDAPSPPSGAEPAG